MNEVIPVEAVEAATDALIASKLGDHPGINGEEFVEAAMAMLEAAAPYIRAQALECAADQLDRELSETRQAQEKPWEWLAGIADAEQALRAYAARYTLNTDGDE